MRFDDRTHGTPEEDWLASPRWAEVPSLVLDEPRRLVVVAAQPDDESLGAGGLMARVAARGVPVQVVVATDGDESDPRSPTTAGQQRSAVRRQELRAAVAQLAPGAIVQFLGLPDGALRFHVGELSDGIRAAAGNEGEGTLIVAPWRNDGHEDHDAAGSAASVVAREIGAQLLEYPVWMWHWARPGDGVVPWREFVSMQLTEAESESKARAIHGHASQGAPLSKVEGEWSSVAARFQEYFHRPFEAFVTPLGSRTLTRDHFDDFYQGKEDPWGFETRWYEIRKRSLTLASLPRPLFASGLEIGCSIGVLTAELAGRCATLVATDIAEQPLQRARVRLIEQSHVTVKQTSIPADWPEGSFDLVVLSEVAYYWSPEDLQQVIRRIDGSLTEDGVVVACHGRHRVDGYPQRGDDVHETLRAFPGLRLLAEHREEDFLLDVFVRPSSMSVAGEAGLL